MNKGLIVDTRLNRGICFNVYLVATVNSDTIQRFNAVRNQRE